MAGKKPHIDFAQRPYLDGSEEIYSQHKDWCPTEQKFTLAQVRAWILQGELTEKTELFEATQDKQTAFDLAYPVLLPELAEVHFEKLKLTYGREYIIRNQRLFYTGLDFEICIGERIEVRYLYKA